MGVGFGCVTGAALRPDPRAFERLLQNLAEPNAALGAANLGVRSWKFRSGHGDDRVLAASVRAARAILTGDPATVEGLRLPLVCDTVATLAPVCNRIARETLAVTLLDALSRPGAEQELGPGQYFQKLVLAADLAQTKAETRRLAHRVLETYVDSLSGTTRPPVDTFLRDRFRYYGQKKRTSRPPMA